MFVPSDSATTRVRLRRTLVVAIALALVFPAVPVVADPGPEVGPGSADHVFTFADDVVGEQPDYISLPWQQTNVEVVDSDWALDGRALRIDPYGTNAFFAAVFDEVPEQVNAEVLMRFRDTGPSSSQHWMSGVGARIDDAAVTGVLSQSRDGANGLVLATVDDGTFDWTAFAVSSDTYLRTRWVDGEVWAKMWGGSLASEPDEWSVAEHALTGPTSAAGGVGITRFFGEHTTEVDYITVDNLDTDVPDDPSAVLRIMPVGNSLTSGSTNAPGPQPTYRMFLYDHLVASGLESGSDFDFVGPYDTHPSSSHDYLRQGDWDHDSLSFSGWRTSDVASAIGTATATYDPDVLLIMIGVNDLRATGADPQVAADNVSDAINASRNERPDVQVLLAEIPPAQPQYDTLITDYNSLLRDLADDLTSASSPIVTVDMFTDYDIAVHHYDDVHPNSDGDELLASRWADALYDELGIGAPWGATTPQPVAPVAMFTAGPQGTIDVADVVFEFDADVADATFECQLNGGGWTDCVSPLEMTGLADGTYTLEVRATADGLTGEPAARTWTVDTTDPGDSPDPDPDDGDGTGEGGSGTGTDDAADEHDSPPGPVVEACSPEIVTSSGLTDVTSDAVHGDSIDCVAWYGITDGLADGSFDPAGTVTRGHQASFIARLIEVLGGDLPDAPRSSLSDIAGTTHEHRIAQLEAIGVVTGRTDGTFGASEPVTRAQTTSLLVRAWGYLTTPLPAGVPGRFEDVSTGVHVPAIEAAAERGIVFGRADGTFGPDMPTRRDQMASLIARTLEKLVEEGLEATPLAD